MMIIVMMIDYYTRPLEICLVDDMSTPAAHEMASSWIPRLEAADVQVVYFRY